MNDSVAALPKAWEQAIDESSKAFAAFAVYRNLGPANRSIDTAWRRVRSAELSAGVPAQAAELKLLSASRAPKTWRDWSAQHAWVYRASAWDGELDRLARNRLVADHRAMLEKHRAMGAGLIAKAADRLLTIVADDLKAQDVAAFIKVGVTIERQAFELPDTIVETRLSGSVSTTVGGVVSVDVEHKNESYETLIKLLLNAPDKAIIAADRLSGRMAPTSSLPRSETEPRETLPSTTS